MSGSQRRDLWISGGHGRKSQDFDLSKVDLQKLVSSKDCQVILLQGLGVGFGNLIATLENVPPGFGEHQLSEDVGDASVKEASNCCNSLGNCYCCMCSIQCCSKINNQCAIAFTQLCVSLSCIACFSCCSDE